jgi:hypothetical protein
LYAEQIKEHFSRFFGFDVGVSFKNPGTHSEVVLYRPDRLSDKFVLLAFAELQKSSPRVARTIDKVIVSYESPLGRTQRGIDLSFTVRNHQLRSVREPSRTKVSGPS